MAVSVWVRAGVPRGGVFGTGGAAPAVPPPALRGWLLASRARPGSGAVRPRPKFRAGRAGCRYRPGHGEAAPLPGPNRQRDGARGHRRTSDEAVGSGEEGGVSRGAGTPPGRFWVLGGCGGMRGAGAARDPPSSAAALLWAGAIPTGAPGFSTPGSASPVHLLGGITG